MIDQANDLRRLVLQAAERPCCATGRRATTVLVAGGKGGVGTTTVAVNLAVAAASQGAGTVLVDGDADRPDLQTLCRLRQRHTISDVINGRRTLGEALQRGPGGVMILPGTWAAADLADATEMRQTRLLDQLAGLARSVELIVVDGGNGLHSFARRLWQTCEDVVLVSSTETNAVLDSYAALKVAVAPGRRPRIHLLVNMCADGDEADEVHRRISRSCQRFLGFSLPPGHWLPADASIVAAGREGMPFAISQPESTATGALLALVRSFESMAEDRPGKGSTFPTERPLRSQKNNLPTDLNSGEKNADNHEDRNLLMWCQSLTTT